MIGILTGDIINSRKLPSDTWMEGLKTILNSVGTTPQQWEIYRGDEFQVEIKNAEEALHLALRIKAYLRTLKLDARMSIGIGDKTYTAEKISESNGSAFVRSGEVFSKLKKQKLTLAVNTGKTEVDNTLNLMLQLGLTFMDQWLVQSAEFAALALENDKPQEELGKKLGINQAAVSRRRKRSHFDLVLELEKYFRDNIKNLDV